MRRLKKVLKITGIVLSLLFITFYIFFYTMTAPRSDEEVLEQFQELGVTPEITHEI